MATTIDSFSKNWMKITFPLEGHKLFISVFPMVIMLDLKELHNCTELDFVKTVLAAVSQVFKAREKKYLGRTRLMKLVAFVADELDFPLTRGWYRYGYYAPVPNQQISHLFEVHQTFEKFPCFQPECSEETWNTVKNVVSSLKPHFVTNQIEFDKWVHEEMAPAPYRKYYKYETLFYDKITHIRDVISSKGQFGSELSDFSDIVTDFERSLGFVENTQALELLHEYIDFWELLVLRIQNRGITSQMASLVSELVKIYHEYLRPALSPYEKTLKGTDAEQEKESFRRQVKSNLRSFREQMEFYKEWGKSQNLIATLEEIRDDLEQRTANWGEEKKENFRKMLSEYVGGYI